MKVKRRNRIFFCITVLILVLCMALIAVFSGFEHEAKKFKTLLVTVVLVLLFQYLFGDPIKFTLLAIDAACWPPKQRKFATDRAADRLNRMDYLKLRLNSLKSQLLLTEEHRNEKLNKKYKLITQDLCLYGKYFFFLLLVVLVTRDSYRYYNTATVTEMLLRNHSRYLGLEEVLNVGGLFNYIELSLIDAFDPNATHGGDAGVAGWLHVRQSKMLGVVRLRQLRLDTPYIGLTTPEFTKKEYMPKWELPYKRLHYMDKYWRIYEPWLPMKYVFNFLTWLLLKFDHVGQFLSYPEMEGYITVLARNKENSQKVLTYLNKFRWLNHNTSALFIDFTMYNVDVNIFTVCTLYVELTPFGALLPHVNVDSVKLLENLDQSTAISLFVLLMYVLVVIQFSKALVLKLWYESSELKKIWNIVDLIIFILNIVVLALIVVREWLVAYMLKKVEGASKTEFIDFRMPAHLHNATMITAGFLIGITTLRLWKIFQFASVFQLFTRTLSSAWKAVASTAIVIALFLVAFGIAMDTINGNNSANFNKLVKSIVTCICFSFGYSSQITPEDLFHGGQYLGVLLYIGMSFVIVVLLMNVFVSLINDYFTTAKANRHQAQEGTINFFQFLRVEYSSYFRIFQQIRFLRKSYHSHNRTVNENVARELEEQERKKLTSVVQEESEKEMDRQKQYMRRIERMYTVSAILETQLDILEIFLFEKGEEKEQEAEVIEDEQ